MLPRLEPLLLQINLQYLEQRILTLIPIIAPTMHRPDPPQLNPQPRDAFRRAKRERHAAPDERVVRGEFGGDGVEEDRVLVELDREEVGLFHAKHRCPRGGVGVGQARLGDAVSGLLRGTAGECSGR